MPGSPLASSADRRSRGAWALLLGATTLSLLLWAALDQRPPDDHDAWYTHHVIGFMNDLAGMSPPRAVARFGFFAWAESDHPPVASIGTWATLAMFGTSRFVYRMATLPFFLLLVTGATLAGWELLGRRWGFVTGLLVAGLPSVVNASRKADFVFHAAGLSAVCLALALGLALRRPRSLGPWLAFGAVAGLRMNSHSLSVVDLGALAAALVVLELAALWTVAATKDPFGAARGSKPGAPLVPRRVWMRYQTLSELAVSMAPVSMFWRSGSQSSPA